VVRKEIDPRLDAMYNRTVRCPYCRTRIAKYTTTCEKCGITKDQIFYASNKQAKKIIKEKTGEKIFKTRHRPDDVMFTTMAIFTILFGLFGVHDFYVGRRIRGWMQVSFIAIGFVVFMVTSIHPLLPARNLFEDNGWVFPTDWLALIAVILWVVDAFAVVFGMYKYPVRLAEAKK